MTFKPTHKITVTTTDRVEVIDVQECDGCLYTSEEWESEVGADWTIDNGLVFFQGRPGPYANCQVKVDRVGEVRS